MNDVTIYNQQRPVAEFNAELFNDFIKWIDRSERTTKTYITNFRQFIAWMKYQGITAPTRPDIINYREWLTIEHDAIALDQETGWKYRTDKAGARIRVNCKPNTVAQYLRAVRQFFSWTAASGLYPDIAANVHAPRVKQDVHRKEALTAKEVLTIEESITATAQQKEQQAQQAAKDRAGRVSRATEQGSRLYAMYLLTVTAGLRTIEISRANVKDFETKGGQAYIYIYGKGHTEADQKKPLAPEVAKALTDYLMIRKDQPTGSSPLFVSTGNRSGGKRIASTTISKMLKKAMQEAGYNSERITAHSLRHTAGTAVQELTGNLYTTQQYMRHSNPATTEIYLHTDTEKAEAGIAQDLYNLYHGIEQSSKAKLERLINTLSSKQLDQLAGIAAAMV